MSKKIENTVVVSDKDIQCGHNMLKVALEIDRQSNKGISRKITNSTVAKRLIVAGMEVKKVEE